MAFWPFYPEKGIRLIRVCRPGGYSLIRAYINGDVRPARVCFSGFFLKQGIDFINFCLKQGIFSYLFLDDKQPAFTFYECLKLGIKNRNSVLNRVGKSAISVLRILKLMS